MRTTRHAANLDNPIRLEPIGNGRFRRDMHLTDVYGTLVPQIVNA